LKGGKARAARLTSERRSEIAKKAAIARWSSTKGGMMADNGKQVNTEKAGKEENAELIKLAEVIIADRKKPLLIMFYPPRSLIAEGQIELLHTVLNSGGVQIAEPLKSLDVLIHTVGGEPTTAYRLAQVIRDFTQEATFLVPEFAYSGGTLICLSGDSILLGNHAVLSPIDITSHRSYPKESGGGHPRFREEEDPDTEVELVAIDHFIKVATQARIEIETEFRRRKWSRATSQVEQAMLCKMVDEMGITEIAKVFREKNITQEYARELLRCYMFKDSKSTSDMDAILRRLVVEAPSHEFYMDYHICTDIGLKVGEMGEDLSDYCNDALKQMKKMASQRLIGEYITGGRLPFFQYFPYNVVSATKVIETEVLALTQEVSNGNRKGNANKKQREKVVPKRKKNA